MAKNETEKKEKWMSTEREIYQAYCSAEGRQHTADGVGMGGMAYVQPHACDKIFNSRHLYSHPERAGVDYIDHATN